MSRVELTNLDRVLWPRAGFTKGELISYYRDVAPALLAHIAGRPLTLGRFPRGVEQRGFAQTQCRGRPEWLATATVRLANGELREHCLVDGVDSLLWVANQCAVELHTFVARGRELERPAALVIDLDPGREVSMPECAAVAMLVRELIGEQGLEAGVKSSGSSGLHVLARLPGDAGFAQVRDLARRLAAAASERRPDLATDRLRDPQRSSRVLVDWAQNSPRRTLVAPYSLRATPWPLVSAPLDWTEVAAAAQTDDPAALAVGPAAAVRRLAANGDQLAFLAPGGRREPGSPPRREASEPRRQDSD